MMTHSIMTALTTPDSRRAKAAAAVNPLSLPQAILSKNTTARRRGRDG
jgi:hypothetical protein